MLMLPMLACAAGTARAQRAVVPVGADTVTVAIGAQYDFGAFRRFWVGGAYRDLWSTPIRIPVLNLGAFAGGLRPIRIGGGMQTVSLRFRGADGVEYVFRSIEKDHVGVRADWKGGIVESVAHDLTSNANPVGFLVASSILDAAGVLHAKPTLVVMPDDPSLGTFRAEFSGRVGEIEEVPAQQKGRSLGFANATRIIDSDSLRWLLDHDATQHVDASAFLAARLVDMLLNDWDRHPGQWKWAQLARRPDAAWEPIPRDRDKALISRSGMIAGVAGHLSQDLSLIPFTDGYPSIESLESNSGQFDRRLLSGLASPAWDSVARALQRRITDQAIDGALGTIPVELRSRNPEFARKLRHRRDSLPELAARFYHAVAQVVDVHGTDASDRAAITYLDSDHVEVTLRSGAGAAYYQRRFDARETREVRVYLHGGDDSAAVRGDVQHGIPVRIIGGNGTNVLIDSSVVAGRRGAAQLYDAGAVSGVKYGVDTLFSRRPFVREGRALLEPKADVGTHIAPLIELALNHDYGIEPTFGLAARSYGFGTYPYASLVQLTGQYSFKLSRYRVGLFADKRLERSPVHFTGLAQVSQLDLVNFHGYGNQSPQTDTSYYVARQSQWLFRPAVAVTIAPNVELSLALTVQQSVTDTTRGHFVADSQPYGFGSNGRFGEVGVQLGFNLDTRDRKQHARAGDVVDLTASYMPAAWDVTRPFESIAARFAHYLTFPIPTHPYLALSVGGKKDFGDAPIQDAAFVGGHGSIRTRDPQSLAGDASVYATAGLRIPVATFTLILPANAGLLATHDIGRVWVKGDSPGGWHSAFGAGFWIGVHDLTADVRLLQSEDGKPAVIAFRIGRTLGANQ
jgi:hypothetical protein